MVWLLHRILTTVVLRLIMLSLLLFIGLIASAIGGFFNPPVWILTVILWVVNTKVAKIQSNKRATLLLGTIVLDMVDKGIDETTREFGIGYHRFTDFIPMCRAYNGDEIYNKSSLRQDMLCFIMTTQGVDYMVHVYTNKALGTFIIEVKRLEDERFI